MQHQSNAGIANQMDQGIQNQPHIFTNILKSRKIIEYCNHIRYMQLQVMKHDTKLQMLRPHIHILTDLWYTYCCVSFNLFKPFQLPCIKGYWLP